MTSQTSDASKGQTGPGRRKIPEHLAQTERITIRMTSAEREELVKYSGVRNRPAELGHYAKSMLWASMEHGAGIKKSLDNVDDQLQFLMEMIGELNQKIELLEWELAAKSGAEMAIAEATDKVEARVKQTFQILLDGVLSHVSKEAESVKAHVTNAANHMLGESTYQGGVLASAIVETHNNAQAGARRAPFDLGAFKGMRLIFPFDFEPFWPKRVGTGDKEATGDDAKEDSGAKYDGKPPPSACAESESLARHPAAEHASESPVPLKTIPATNVAPNPQAPHQPQKPTGGFGPGQEATRESRAPDASAASSSTTPKTTRLPPTSSTQNPAIPNRPPQAPTQRSPGSEKPGAPARGAQSNNGGKTKPPPTSKPPAQSSGDSGQSYWGRLMAGLRKAKK